MKDGMTGTITKGPRREEDCDGCHGGIVRLVSTSDIYCSIAVTGMWQSFVFGVEEQMLALKV